MTVRSSEGRRGSGRPALPGPLDTLWRGGIDAALPAISWFVGLCAVGIVAGALLFGRHGGGTTVDARVNTWFDHHHLAWIVTVAQRAATVGSVPGLIIIALIIGVALWWMGWRVRAFVPIAAVLGAEAVVYVVKEVMARHRPPSAAAAMYPWVPRSLHESDFSFPSGHTTGTTALVFALAVLIIAGGARWWPWVVAAVLGAAQAVFRLVLGVHWFTDVLVGFCLGAVWGGAVATLLREPREHRRRGSPSVPV